MAPVGSRESLAADIQAGADSIYFGIESLNMRARSASTFTINDLREIAQICDEHGIKSYLTINTIIYDEDIVLMRTIVDAAKEAYGAAKEEYKRLKKLAEKSDFQTVNAEVQASNLCEDYTKNAINAENYADFLAGERIERYPATVVFAVIFPLMFLTFQRGTPSLVQRFINLSANPPNALNFM